MPKNLEPVSLNVTMPTIMAYADLTDDYNPIHVDREFAEKTEMKGIIAHGTMSLNLIWQSLRKTLGNEAVAGARLNIRFVRPVRENDTVTGGGIEQEGAPGTYDVWVSNQKGEQVITGTATFSQ
ncbi:MaoC family dehydratase [Roseovarius amoyensis]|uniref:MaoC family dehydratase n=1 Tax=Roseovarius amoyensis TaxID=2211448 RepID=UPI000DBE63E9|nr:MaoC family dehydratase [Roseovarius amoyensis]